MADSQEYIELIKKLIATPSFSREEDKTADILMEFFHSKSMAPQRKGNNIIVRNKHFAEGKPTVLLNSHHDTVRPNESWKKDPFTPVVVDGRLYGLGSNDAGGCLVSLIAAFEHFHEKTMNFNLILAATAEEEVSGRNGLESVLPQLGDIELAIVGEPTQLRMAVAEKGLMVLDCTAKGRAGHAARDEGDNAIYKALPDIEWFRDYRFPINSKMLGDVKMSVTVINSGTQHNVVPDECRFTVDVRSTDAYTNEEILEIIDKNTVSEVRARSTRLQPSGLPEGHFMHKIAADMSIETFGSPTLSDQALMPFPSVKIGPGDSARSHTADEFIALHEIEEGIGLYIRLLEKILFKSWHQRKNSGRKT